MWVIYPEQIECVDYGHGGPGLRFFKIFVINVTNINEPPFDISLSSNFIKENSPVGQVVGELSAEDVDSTEVSYKPFQYCSFAGQVDIFDVFAIIYTVGR